MGVSGDKETIEKKGKIVMSEQERTEILMHCKWVDEVICPCPWTVTVDFLMKHNIHYVAHDDIPYASAGADDIYSEVKKLVTHRLRDSMLLYRVCSEQHRELMASQHQTSS